MTKLLHRTAKSARRHRVIAALLGVLSVFGTAAAVYAAAPTADFSLAGQPPSQTIGSGSSATYVISIAPTNGFNGKVTLTVGTLPKGTSATWTVGSTTSSASATLTVPAGSSATQEATLTIGGGQPPAGTYSPVVTAKSGSISHTATLTLVVVNQNAANFTLSVTPSAQTVAQGTITSTVTVSRANWSGAVTFGAVTGLPSSGATASITPTSTSGSSATLTITTTSSAPPGMYTLTVPATAVVSGTTSTTRYASFTLNVLPSFRISGSLASPLTLGSAGTQPLDLSISNPYTTALTISNIVVTLASVQQASGAVGTCGQTGTPQSPNFRINPLPVGYSVTVPAGATMKLSQLGGAETPTVTWLDQSWAQNGCLGATLNFTYAASGQF